MFIFYEGHNEFLEGRTYGNLKNRGPAKRLSDFVRTRTRIRTAVGWILLASHGSHSESNLLRGEVEAILDRTIGPEKYHRDPQWASWPQNPWQRIVLGSFASHHRTESPTRLGSLCGIASYRGRLLEKLGRADEAFEWFAEAVRRDPDDCLAHYRLGSAYMHRKEYESARERFNHDVRAIPARAPSVLKYQLHMDFGMCYVEMRRWQDAAQEFEIAVNLSARSPEAATALNAALNCLRTEK